MSIDCSGKVVVICGSATGLGRAMAEGFAQGGAQLVLADVDGAGLDDALQKVRALGVKAVAAVVDVMQPDSLVELARIAEAEFGRVDILCSNAGVNEYPAAAWEKTLGDWQWVLGVNLFGLINTVNAFMPMLQRQGFGHIVSTASSVSLHVVAGMAAYVASKKANLGYCETLQYDLWSRGSAIKVSVVCPGRIASDMPNSARNRPAELSGRRPTDSEIAAMSAYLGEGGLTPDEAARIVLDGIAEQRFYILTNPKDAEHFRAWADAVLTGTLAPMKKAAVKLNLTDSQQDS